MSDPTVPVRVRAIVPGRRPALRWEYQDARHLTRRRKAVAKVAGLEILNSRQNSNNGEKDKRLRPEATLENRPAAPLLTSSATLVSVNQPGQIGHR